MFFYKEFIGKYMKDNDQAAILQLFNEIELEELPSETVIFQEKDPSNNKMYVVLEGTVNILKEKQKNVFEDDFKKFVSKDTDDGGLWHGLAKMFGDIKTKKAQNSEIALRHLAGQGGIGKTTSGQNLHLKRLGTKTYNQEDPSEKNGIPKKTNFDSPLGVITSKEDLEFSKLTFEERMVEQYGDVVVELTKGKMFGELAQLNTKPRAATIITSSDCKLMVLRKKAFEHIKKFFSTEMLFKKEFLFRVMPKLDEINADKYVTDILNNFSNVGLTKGTKISIQGEIGETIYFVRSGVCSIEFIMPSGKKKKICEVECGTVVGEECLFDSEYRYKFTVSVQSQEAKFLTLNRRYMQKSIPYTTLEDLKLSYDEKERFRILYIERLIIDKQVCSILENANPKYYAKEHVLSGIKRQSSLNKDNSKVPKEIQNEKDNFAYKNYFQMNFQKCKSLNEQLKCANLVNIMKELAKGSACSNKIDLEKIQMMNMAGSFEGEPSSEKNQIKKHSRKNSSKGDFDKEKLINDPLPCKISFI